MQKNEFKDWVQDMINLHPDKRTDILDFFWLAMSEIEEGGSERMEIDRAKNDIEELINENI